MSRDTPLLRRTLERASIALRAEGALLRLQLGRVVTQVVLLAVALIFALLGLVVANFAAFFALEPWLGSAWAGAALGVADFAVAAVLIARAAAPTRATAEEKLARELLDGTYQGIVEDVEAATGEARQLLRDVHAIGAAMKVLTGALTAPLQGLLDVLRTVVGAARSASPSDSD